MPQMDELLDRLGTAHIFLTLDLTKGYWQIILLPESKGKSAFFNSVRFTPICHSLVRSGWREVRYLGFLLRQGWVIPLVNKTAAILQCLQLKSKKQVRSFLGLANYYHWFILDFFNLASSLMDVTSEPQIQSSGWSSARWRFWGLKRTYVVVLSWLAMTSLNLFYCRHNALAVLYQKGKEQLVLYIGHNLSPRERRYSTIEN